MFQIGEKSAAGYPVAITNDGAMINLVVPSTWGLVLTVAHFYLEPHEAARCPLCHYSRTGETGAGKERL